MRIALRWRWNHMCISCCSRWQRTNNTVDLLERCSLILTYITTPTAGFRFVHCSTTSTRMYRRSVAHRTYHKKSVTCSGYMINARRLQWRDALMSSWDWYQRFGGVFPRAPTPMGAPSNPHHHAPLQSVAVFLWMAWQHDNTREATPTDFTHAAKMAKNSKTGPSGAVDAMWSQVFHLSQCQHTYIIHTHTNTTHTSVSDMVRSHSPYVERRMRILCSKGQ